MNCSRALKASGAAVCIVLATGCSSMMVATGGYVLPEPRPTGEAVAGVARVDITPPPGFPTGGHGPAGHLARGHWTRLWARAFFFQDAQGHNLVLVSADLFAMPGGLHAAVARRAAKELRSRTALAPASIVLAATHTHQGPGNFTTAKLYTDFAAFYGGFSEDMFEFLVARITEAVVRAATHAFERPGPVKLLLREGVVDPRRNVLFNRAPRAFLLNRDAAVLMDDLDGPLPAGDTIPSWCERIEGEPTGGWTLEGCPRLRAVDRRVRVLEIYRGPARSQQRIGALVFFAMHPTVLFQSAPFFSADATGYAVSRLEEDLRVDERTPVIGYFNGAEGDITARRPSRSLARTAKLGDELTKQIACVLDPQACEPDQRAASPALEVAVDVSARRHVEKATRGRGKRAETPRATIASVADCDALEPLSALLADRPQYGAAALGGGEGDRLILHDLGWRSGVRDRPTDRQGPKLPALDSQLVREVKLTNVLAPVKDFPPEIPLTLARIGPLTLAAVPSEITTSVGAGIRSALGDGAGSPVVIVGLANEYIGYTVSADEYALQDYAGASTMWGPYQAAFMRCWLQKLRDTAPRVRRRVGARRYRAGPRASEDFGPDFLSEPFPSPDDGLEEVLVRRDGSPVRDLPMFVWDEHVDRRNPGRDELPVDFDTTQVRHVEVQRQAAVGVWTTVASDIGTRILTLLVRGDPAAAKRRALLRREWSAIWLEPYLTEDRSVRGSFRFRVTPGDGRAVRYSEPFTVPRQKGRQQAAWIIGPAVGE